MRIFVIGGTGFLGSFLLPELVAAGHEVTVLSRSEEKAARFASLGIRAVIGDLLRSEAFFPLLSPHDIVISIAMPKIRPGRISKKRLHQLQEDTAAYFATSLSVAELFSCPLMITLGTSFKTTGEEIADENQPLERIGIARIGAAADPLIRAAEKRNSPPLVQMLPGQIYGPGGLFKNLMYEWMKTGRYRIIGAGDNCIPRIHVEDCSAAYLKALEKIPVGEKFILADDEACTMREFADCMADNMRVPRPKSVPGFIIRAALGKLMYETVTMNCRVSNHKAKSYLDWKLKYPTYREGLPAAIRKIERIELQT